MLGRKYETQYDSPTQRSTSASVLHSDPLPAGITDILESNCYRYRGVPGDVRKSLRRALHILSKNLFYILRNKHPTCTVLHKQEFGAWNRIYSIMVFILRNLIDPKRSISKGPIMIYTFGNATLAAPTRATESLEGIPNNVWLSRAYY